jgi:hypothetical protein
MNEFEVTCNDGTKDVSNGEVAPCLNHGGVKPNPVEKKMTDTQKWGIIIGGSALIYLILWKLGSFDTKAQ